MTDTITIIARMETMKDSIGCLQKDKRCNNEHNDVSMKEKEN
jgi:hypothetical protein